VCLSDFGAMSLLLAPRSDVVGSGLRRNRRRLCDPNHVLVGRFRLFAKSVTAITGARSCPLQVRSGQSGTRKLCPLYPPKADKEQTSRLSALCQKRTFALQQKQNALFDHSVGAKPRGLGLSQAAPPSSRFNEGVRGALIAKRTMRARSNF